MRGIQYALAILAVVMATSGNLSIALARVAPLSLTSKVDSNYQPVEADEKGLWAATARLEEITESSKLVVQDPKLVDYLSGVLRRMIGPQTDRIRIYVVDDPSFNASMAPNGMLTIYTGALVRVRSEAQLAAVLGHEVGHYVLLHQVAQWRNQRFNTGLIAFVSAGASVGAGATLLAGGTSANAQSWIDMANSVNMSLAASMFTFSRSEESEADAYGLKLLVEGGYPLEAAGEVWQQLIQESKASALAAGKKYKENSASTFSTHPANNQRLSDLSVSAAELRAALNPVVSNSNVNSQFELAIGPHRFEFLREQVEMNDAGASLYLIESAAAQGWTGALRYLQGEVYRKRADDALAAAAYAQAVAQADAPAEAWRAYGYAMLKAEDRASANRAFTRYLEMVPNANDAEMIRFSIAH